MNIKKQIITTLLLFGIVVTILGISGHIETHYSTVAKVFSVSDESTLLIDGAGYIWEVTNRPDLKKDSFVEIKFYNNTTDYTREDDIIVNIKEVNE